MMDEGIDRKFDEIPTVDGRLQFDAFRPQLNPSKMLHRLERRHRSQSQSLVRSPWRDPVSTQSDR